ncbi:hypothetical protein [Myxosarcina sp. GI1(2024)]
MLWLHRIYVQLTGFDLTIDFGRGSSDEIDNLPIAPDWNYIVRLYKPRKKILDGSWVLPEAMPVE